jgi:hypothetical protein
MTDAVPPFGAPFVSTVTARYVSNSRFTVEKTMKRVSLRALGAFAVLLPQLTACPPSSTAGTGPMAVFGDPEAPAPLAFEAYPWPNDLLLKSGRIRVTFRDFGEDRDPGVTPASQFLADTLAERGGFSGAAAVIFPFDAPLDVATLPATPSDAASSTSVFLMGVTGEHQGRRLPARVRFNERTQQLFVTPHYGERLLNGERYAAVVTTQVKGTDGQAVRASAGFRTLWPGPQSPGTGCGGRRTALAEPEGIFRDLPALLRGVGLSADDVAVATVFTVDKPEVELATVRDLVRAEPLSTLVRTDVFPRQGYDLDRLMGVPTFTGLGMDDGAVPHAHVSHVIHGTFRTPLFVATEPGRNGVFTFGAPGVPLVTGHEDVPFTLVLPTGVGNASSLPLLFYQHGLGGQRSEVMVVAEAFCAMGYAVVGMDLPFHGSRTPPLPAGDGVNNITGEHVGDGIGDSAGLAPAFLAFGITSSNPAVLPLTPSIVRDSFRQGHADIFGFIRHMIDGDKAPLVDGLAEFAGLNFDPARIHWMSESFGSIHGVPVVALEPAIKGAVFSVGGGGLVVDTLLNSPEYAPALSLFLYQKLGLMDALTENLALDYVGHPPETIDRLQVYQSTLKPKNPIAYAALLARKPVTVGRNVVFMAPFSDEAVPNQAEEALAHAAGATALRNGTGPNLRYGNMPVVDGPITGNVNGFTVAFAQFTPAGHGMLTRRRDQSEKEPGFPPFVDRAQVLTFDNPTDVALKSAAAFLSGLSSGNQAFALAQ